MDILNNLLDGIIAAFGMWIMMTVMSIISWFALKKWVIKTVTEVWANIKEEGLKLDGVTVEGKLKTKKLFKKKKDK